MYHVAETIMQCVVGLPFMAFQLPGTACFGCPSCVLLLSFVIVVVSRCHGGPFKLLHHLTQSLCGCIGA